MVWELLAENKIQEAIEQGHFENLPGKGKPLDLGSYFETPAAERAGYSVLKNAGVVPPEVQMLKDIEILERALAACNDAVKRKKLNERLGTLRVSYNMTMEKRRLGQKGNRGLEGGML